MYAKFVIYDSGYEFLGTLQLITKLHGIAPNCLGKEQQKEAKKISVAY